MDGFSQGKSFGNPVFWVPLDLLTHFWKRLGYYTVIPPTLHHYYAIVSKHAITTNLPFRNLLCFFGGLLETSNAVHWKSLTEEIDGDREKLLSLLFSFGVGVLGTVGEPSLPAEAMFTSWWILWLFSCLLSLCTPEDISVIYLFQLTLFDSKLMIIIIDGTITEN